MKAFIQPTLRSFDPVESIAVTQTGGQTIEIGGENCSKAEEENRLDEVVFTIDPTYGQYLSDASHISSTVSGSGSFELCAQFECTSPDLTGDGTNVIAGGSPQSQTSLVINRTSYSTSNTGSASYAVVSTGDGGYIITFANYNKSYQITGGGQYNAYYVRANNWIMTTGSIRDTVNDNVVTINEDCSA